MSNYLRQVIEGKLPLNEDILREVKKASDTLKLVEMKCGKTKDIAHVDITLSTLLSGLTEMGAEFSQLLHRVNQIASERAMSLMSSRSDRDSPLGRQMYRWRLLPFLRPYHFYSRAYHASGGLFNGPLKTPSSFKELNDHIMDPASTSRSKKTTVRLFDDLSNEICKAADMVECVRQMHNNEYFREAAEESSRDFCQLIEGLNTYTELYNRLKGSKEKESGKLDDLDKRTIDLFIDDFKQSGVHLPPEQREEFVRLSSEIFDAGARYQWQCDVPVEIGRTDKYRFSLPSTRLTSPVSYSSQQEKRSFIHSTFYKSNPGQESELIRLVTSRHDLARLTGFESFAHRAQHNSVLGTYDNVKEFLHLLIEKCQPAVNREVAILYDIQSQCAMGQSKVLECDLPYLIDLYKTRAYGESLRLGRIGRFITVDSLIRGFVKLANRLYDVNLVERNIENGETWNSMMVKLEALDPNNNSLGFIYLDVEKRQSKAVGDCHFTVRCSKELDNQEWQTPIIVVSLALCDESQKNWRKSPVHVHAAENFFHEMGHAMHSILGRTRYQHIAGTRCPQDFSEIPSNLMEFFFNDIQVFRSLLRGENDEEIPIDEAASHLSARSAFSAIEVVQQAAYSLFDLELHGPEAPELLRQGKLTTGQLFHSMLSTSLPQITRSPNTAFQHRFHHLVQYGARYYSYLVARAGASLIWSSQFREDPFNRDAGMKWAKIQSYGGGLAPLILLENILGFRPTADNLTSAISDQSIHTSNLDAINI
ncbi:hypothetical protein WR25_11686 isoform A [Diploscapter pachys]|nr:hypothetical protein WR25_11686 isoform A [Diploscapter pachys]